MGVTESHREPERDRERASKSQREPQREPVRARLNKTLFCHDTSKYGIFCRKLLKYALRAEKNGWKCAVSRLHTFFHYAHRHSTVSCIEFLLKLTFGTGSENNHYWIRTDCL